MLTDIQRIAARKLKMLNDAVELNDLQVPPANRLEALKEGKGSPASELMINGGCVFVGKKPTQAMLKL